MWASPTSGENTFMRAYSFLMFSARVRLVASGPCGTLAFSLFGCMIICSTSYRGTPRRVCIRRACSNPLSMSLASTNSLIRGDVTMEMPDARTISSTSRLIDSAVSVSTRASRTMASTIFWRSQPSIASSDVRTKRAMSVVSFTRLSVPTPVRAVF